MTTPPYLVHITKPGVYDFHGARIFLRISTSGVSIRNAYVFRDEDAYPPVGSLFDEVAADVTPWRPDTEAELADRAETAAALQALQFDVPSDDWTVVHVSVATTDPDHLSELFDALADCAHELGDIRGYDVTCSSGDGAA